MTDFGAFHSITHSIVTLNDDVQLKHHGIEKPVDYITRKNGVYYETIQGGGASGAGTIVFGGVDNEGTVSGLDVIAQLEAAQSALALTGGHMHIKNGDYTCTQTWTIPGGIIITSDWALLNWTGAALDDYVIKVAGTGPSRLSPASPVGTMFRNLVLVGDVHSKGIQIQEEHWTHIMDNVKIYGHTHADARGLRLEGCIGNSFTNVWHDSNTVGLELRCNDAEDMGCNANSFRTCHYQNSDESGVILTSHSATPGVAGTLCEQNILEHCIMENNGDFGYKDGAGLHSRLTNCWFENNDVNAGGLGVGGDVYLTVEGSYGNSHTSIKDCNFADSVAINLYDAFSTHSKILGNDFRGTVIYLNTCTYPTINRNRFRKVVGASAGYQADAGSDATHLVDAALTQADDWWNYCLLTMIDGVNQGSYQIISDFDAASDTITCGAFGAAIAAGDRYVISPAIAGGYPLYPIIEQNSGFTTRSNGLALIANLATAVTFEHGLPNAPTLFGFSILFEDPGDWYISDSNAENTTVTVTNASAGGMYVAYNLTYLTPL